MTLATEGNQVEDTELPDRVEACTVSYRAWDDFRIFDEIKQPVWVMDFNPESSAYLWANKSYLKLYQCNLTEFAAKDLNDGMSKAVRGVMDGIYEKIQIKKESMFQSKTLYPKGGSPVTLASELRPISVLYPGECQPKTLVLVESTPLNREDSNDMCLSRSNELLQSVQASAMILNSEGELLFANLSAKSEHQDASRVLKLDDVVHCGEWPDFPGTTQDLLDKVRSMQIGDDALELERRKISAKEISAKHKPCQPSDKAGLDGLSSSGAARSTAEWHRISFIPITDPVTSKPAIMVNEYDITPLKQALQDLHAAQQENMALVEAETSARLSRRFVANISHELRTPLNSIIAFNTLLLDAGLNRLHEDFARSAVLSAEALLGLINQILDFSKMESPVDGGNLELNSEPFHLSTLCEEVQDIVACRIAARNVQFVVNCPERAPCLVGDRFRLRQCLINLCDNATKFAKTVGGEVFLNCHLLPEERPGSVEVEFEVIDNGKGIPKDKMALLFKPFSQIDANLSRQHGGTGLGLCITKKIIESMNGTISCSSEEHVRTAFRAKLRLRIAQGNFALQPLEHETTPLSGDVIVCLEKSPCTGSLIRRIGRFGMNVDDQTHEKREKASQPQKVAAAVESNSAGIVVLDIEMFSALSKMLPILDRKLLIIGEQSSLDKIVGQVCSDYVLPHPVKPSTLYKRLHLLCSPEWDTARMDMSTPTGKDRRSPLTSPYRRMSLSEQQMFMNITPPIPQEKQRELAPYSLGGSNQVSMSGEQYRILVVEDQPANQKVASAMLERVFGKGKCVIENADHGGIGLEKATGQGRSYDLILMDIQMPFMDGMECTKRIREWERLRPIHEPRYYIIAATAHAASEDAEDCLNVGMNDYLSKPLSLKKLRDAINSFKAWLTHQQNSLR